MEKPVIQSKEPQKVELEEGKRYSFCSCGLTDTPPFCDGAHKGTEFRSIKYTPEKDETVWACNCKNSSNMPFCDGTHKKL